MTYTCQSHCISSFAEMKNTEKQSEKLDPKTNLIGSLERLYNELDNFPKEQPLESDIFLAIAKETENAYMKLNTFSENFKKIRIYHTYKKE